MTTKSDEQARESYWRDDDFYIADDEEGPRRLSRADIEDFARRRALTVAGIVVFAIAFIVRLGFNAWLGDYPIAPEARDMYEYDQVAHSVLDGKGYSKTWAFTDDRGETVVEYRTTMFRPPAYTLSLAFAYALTNGNPLAARMLLSSFGAATCLLVFLVGRRVFSHKVGFLAGLVAAVYPFMWIPDGMLLPENMYAMLLMYLVFRLYLLREAISAKNVILTGIAAGIVSLTRTEGLAFTAMAVLFVIIACTHLAARKRILISSLVAAIALAVYAPWAWHTWSEFGTLAPSSTVGTMLAGTSNRAAYYDQVYVGSWYYGGLQSDRDALYKIRDPRENEKTVDDYYMRTGVSYMTSHIERIPAVVGARELRAWDIWDPYVTARVELEWGRPMWATYLGLAFYYPALALALYGGWRFRRNWRELVPFYFIAGYFTLFSAATFGTVRYRTWLEPTIVLFATATLYAFARGGLLERSAPLREFLANIQRAEEQPEPDPQIPDRMQRAERLREAKARRDRTVESTDRARLPEGEEFETDLKDDFAAEELGSVIESPSGSMIDEDGVIHIVVDEDDD